MVGNKQNGRSQQNLISRPNERDTRRKGRSPSRNTLTETMNQILSRLSSLEDQHLVTGAEPVTPPPPSRPSVAEPARTLQGHAKQLASAVRSSPERPVNAAVDHPSTADRIIDAIRSINMPAQAHTHWQARLEYAWAIPSDAEPNENDVESMREQTTCDNLPSVPDPVPSTSDVTRSRKA